jgi:hypothetical protein
MYLCISSSMEAYSAALGDSKVSFSAETSSSKLQVCLKSTPILYLMFSYVIFYLFTLNFLFLKYILKHVWSITSLALFFTTSHHSHEITDFCKLQVHYTLLPQAHVMFSAWKAHFLPNSCPPFRCLMGREAFLYNILVWGFSLS